jgi:hypothetical protein
MPFYNGDGKVRDGDLVYGLQEPRDAFWASFSRSVKELYVIEQFYIINGDSTAYKFADPKVTASFRNALMSHNKYTSAVPTGTPSDKKVNPYSPVGNQDIRRKDKGGLEWAVSSQDPPRQVHFILDGLKMAWVVGKSGPSDKTRQITLLDPNAPVSYGWHRKYDASQYQQVFNFKIHNITGSELRWIYRNRHRKAVQERIQFWRTRVQPIYPGSTNMLPIRSTSIPPWDDKYDDKDNPPSLWAGYHPKTETHD